jgi:hypothetical protein
MNTGIAARDPGVQPARHFWQWTSSTGAPAISLATQSTSLIPFTSIV